MQEFVVFKTEPFEELLEKLDVRERQWIEKMEQQLAFNPFAGKPLHSDWFRKKKFENKRLYYIVSKKDERVLLFAFGNKKEQQKIIEHLLANTEKYFRLLAQR